jgi:hypothetical protein
LLKTLVPEYSGILQSGEYMAVTDADAADAAKAFSETLPDEVSSATVVGVGGRKDA